MKALSIKQPWAWAIIYAGKDIENRSWKTGYRGSFLVHASMTFDMDGYQWIRANMNRLGIERLPDILSFSRGGIIGSVKLDHVLERSLSHWFFGPYGFRLRSPEPLEFRPCKGRLGFFDIEMEKEG